MNESSVSAARDRLRCPVCGAGLTDTETGATCDGCSARYPFHGCDGGLDLRPAVPFTVELRVEVGTTGPDDTNIGKGVLHFNPNPTASVEPGSVPHHLSPELVSWIPAAARPGQRALDLGAGGAQNRELIEHAGYEYVSVDFSDERSLYLADAHCLPFAANTFDLVISIAVLEHLHTPVRALSETRRVLAPGGVMIGTVAFLEPYHSRSFFHHSPLGVQHALEAAGFSVHTLAAQPGWFVLDAQAKVLFNGAPTRLKRWLTALVTVFHRLWWQTMRLARRGDFSDDRRRNIGAGAWVFITEST